MADSKTTALTALTTFSGDELFYVVEDDDGTPVSRKITIEDLAAGLAARTELSGTYAPLETSRLIPAAAIIAVQGTPVIGDAGTDVGAMLFDAASTEIAHSVRDLPDEWSTYNIQILWTNAGAGSGNVVWRIDYGIVGDGGNIQSVVTAGTVQTIAAPAQNVLKVTTTDSALAAPAANEYLVVRPRRVGGDAGDTLGNDAGLIAVRLVKAS